MSILEPGTLIVSLLGFLLTFFIIKRVAFKPLSEMMEKRRLHIESQIGDAETNRAESERLLAEQRQQLEAARNDARQIVDAARSRADEQARTIVAEAQAEAQRLLEEGRQLVERERAEALNAALAQVAGLSVELTTKLLRNHVTEPVHQEMLVEAENQLGQWVS